jgi:hypothetical protein
MKNVKICVIWLCKYGKYVLSFLICDAFRCVFKPCFMPVFEMLQFSTLRYCSLGKLINASLSNKYRLFPVMISCVVFPGQSRGIPLSTNAVYQIRFIKRVEHQQQPVVSISVEHLKTISYLDIWHMYSQITHIFTFLMFKYWFGS